MTPVTSYRELVEGIKAQVAAMQVSYADFDELACFPDGLAGKIFGPAQVKKLGAQKIFDALRAAGLKLTLEVDEKQLERMRRQIENKGIKPRSLAHVRSGHTTVSIALRKRLLRELGKDRWAGTSQKERSEHMRMMVNKRWSNEMKRRARQRRQTHKARKKK